MTHHPMFSMPATVASNLRDTVEAARVLAGAQGATLQLVDDLDDLRLKLEGAGLTVGPAEAEWGVTGDPLCVLRAAGSGATDLVDLSLVLTGPDEQPLGALYLSAAPAGSQNRALRETLAILARVLERQIATLRMGPALLAEPMLSLLDRLSELDDGIVSQALLGFLRALAGQQASQVEATAMRIAGLADAPMGFFTSREIMLSRVAQELLDGIGYGALLKMRHDLAAPLSPEEADPELQARADLEPFARLRLIERSFLVAEDPDGVALWFRDEQGDGLWRAITRGGADGWTAIAAEIIEASTDVVVEFARMHLLRRRDLPADEIAEAYELHGVIFWFRNSPDGIEARLEGGEWRLCPMPEGLQRHERALAALSQLCPDMSARLAGPARDWLNRMSQTVQVTPFMPAAAE
ncbi:hypothetical protein [Paracoccus sp. (in: a-proteobacteria)]|uniref:hypothetical protein n=1 Tax=Paracoccus sp. TaxID=267 RepID=UPI00272B5C90|nr:hypothetical protein [Paracoccus sp. (in: a-proteobacteria)]